MQISYSLSDILRLNVARHLPVFIKEEQTQGALMAIALEKILAKKA